MRYAESLRYLNSFLNLERIAYLPGSRFWNIGRMRLLLDWAGHPERPFFPILIAGTKGKGSTGFFLESILKASGVAVGFYCSPHLENPRERIRLGGQWVSEKDWARSVVRLRNILAKHKLPPQYGEFTYFEIMTCLAMLVFREKNIRIGIFEVGMGGRLDATNVLDAKLVILTPIYLDHEAFLGNTLAKIAGEKAAIMRPGADVIVSVQHPEVMKVIHREVRKKKAFRWEIFPARRMRPGLAGDYQKVNAAAALRAACVLKEKYGFKIPNAVIPGALKACDWPGRFEFFKGRPSFLLDGAHNPSSVEALVRNLKRIYPSHDFLPVFGCSRDKKSEKMLDFLSRQFSKIILTPVSNPRTQEIAVLLAQAAPKFRFVFPAGHVRAALKLACELAGPRTLVVVTGSFYLVGEMRTYLTRRRDAGLAAG